MSTPLVRCSMLVALAACGEVHPARDPASPDAAAAPDAARPDGAAPDAAAPDAAPVRCTVPASHATIQAALDDATCPAVAVMPGAYTENLTIARDVRLAGAARDTVIINGAGRASVVAIGAGTVVLEHLT